MTYREAKKQIEILKMGAELNGLNWESLTVAIDCIDKQIPKHPDDRSLCPFCGAFLYSLEKRKHCPDCGQALNWSDKDE